MQQIVELVLGGDSVRCPFVHHARQGTDRIRNQVRAGPHGVEPQRLLLRDNLATRRPAPEESGPELAVRQPDDPPRPTIPEAHQITMIGSVRKSLIRAEPAGFRLISITALNIAMSGSTFARPEICLVT